MSAPSEPDGTLGGEGLSDAAKASDFTEVQHGHGPPSRLPGGETPPTASRPSATTPPPEVEAALPSARFGKFVRVQKLGSGGMGEVWKAWDTELSRWVAVKFLKGDDDDEIQRFKREAQLAGKLDHPNIAPIHDIGQDRDRHFIASSAAMTREDLSLFGR